MMRSILILLSLFVQSASLGQQPCPCDKLLENGLYEHFKITNTGNFEQDIRTYFLSEQFKSDLRSNKWGASVSVPIEGLSGPISVGASAEDREANEFRQKIQQASSLKLATNWGQVLVSSVPNVNLAEQYRLCVKDSCGRFGFSVAASSGADWVVFAVNFVKEFDADPMPKLRFLDVINSSKTTTSMTVGSPILNSNQVSVRRDPKSDVILVIETDRGLVQHKVPAEETDVSKDVPVGTIVSSMLSPEQFYLVTGSNDSSGGIWASHKSKWAPADGRVVPGSRYSRVTSQTNLPDLRGVFLRGLNVMDPVPQVPLPPQQADTESGRVVGSFQSDSIKKHTHELENGSFPVSANHGSDKVDADHDWPRVHYLGTHTVAVRDTGTNLDGEETRAKNRAIYYYIRIN